MPGNPLSLVTTGNGVVKNDITVMVAGWTLTSLREHWYTHSVLVRDHKLSRSDMETKCRRQQNFQLKDIREELLHYQLNTK